MQREEKKSGVAQYKARMQEKNKKSWVAQYNAKMHEKNKYKARMQEKDGL